MTYWNWDILSMGDPDEIENKITEWEDAIDKDSKPKFKFPLEIKDSDLDVMNVEREEPSIDKPKEKKKPLVFKTIENNKNNKNKKGLF